jgi:hypothetical protein
MKILFLTLVRIESIESQGIYQDLLRKFRDNGHDLTIVSPNERKYAKNTKFFKEMGVNILNVWTTNIQKTNIIEKGITTLIIEFFYLRAIKKYIYYRDFDLILYSTPPITFTNLIRFIKNESNAKTYLLLKDIFPQNAIDLKLFAHGGFLYKYFRKKEKLLYRISDNIGCMSPANLSYLLKHNPELEENKLEVNPNSIEVRKESAINEFYLFNKYQIPEDKILFIFGGNLGIPQGIDFLKKNISYCLSIKDAFFLIVGDGTEYQNLKDWIQFEDIKNTRLIKELPKCEYDAIIKISHVGLIFLNPIFTIPNFPSRILSYMQNSLPVICATDLATDIGILAVENNFGYNCLTSDFEAFFDCVTNLLNKDVRKIMGENSFNYLKNQYNVDISYKKILDKHK